MANGRAGQSKGKAKSRGGKRDPGAFIAFPCAVGNSPGWRQAGHTARSLLFDIVMGYTGSNNGRLTASLEGMSARGWESPGVLTQAKQELIACGLLVETRKGGFPNRAAWYAVSWFDLDQTEELDINPKNYDSVHRSAYLRPQPYERPKRSGGKPLAQLRAA